MRPSIPPLSCTTNVTTMYSITFFVYAEVSLSSSVRPFVPSNAQTNERLREIVLACFDVRCFVGELEKKLFGISPRRASRSGAIVPRWMKYRTRFCGTTRLNTSARASLCTVFVLV